MWEPFNCEKMSLIPHALPVCDGILMTAWCFLFLFSLSNQAEQWKDYYNDPEPQRLCWRSPTKCRQTWCDSFKFFFLTMKKNEGIKMGGLVTQVCDRKRIASIVLANSSGWFYPNVEESDRWQWPFLRNRRAKSLSHFNNKKVVKTKNQKCCRSTSFTPCWTLITSCRFRNPSPVDESFLTSWVYSQPLPSSNHQGRRFAAT